MDNEIRNSDELAHWGIKGMRWGIRRYQNKDGSLTKAGQRRYDKEMEKLKKEEQVLKNRKATQGKLAKLEAKRASNAAKKKELDGDDEDEKKKEAEEAAAKKISAGKKKVSEMSSLELAEAISRARLEDEYNRLRPDPDEVKREQRSAMMKELLVKPGIELGKNAVSNLINKGLEKAFKDVDAEDSLAALKKSLEKIKAEDEIDKIKRSMEKRRKGEEELSYKDQISKEQARKMKRENDEAEAKAANDEAARKANEQRSKDFYDSTYSKTFSKSSNKSDNDSADRYDGPIEIIDKPKTSKSESSSYSSKSDPIDGTWSYVKDSSSSGKSYTSDYFSGSSTLALPSSSSASVNSGRNWLSNSSILALPAPKDDD